MVSLCYLVSAGLGTLLAIREDLPAEFGGFLHGKDVRMDFVAGAGTALSPPLILLVVLVMFIVFLFIGNRLGKVGAAGLAVLGGCFLFGQLGEPVLWQQFTPSGFHLERLIIAAANLFFPLQMLFFGLWAWRRLIWRDSISPH